jgi:DNA-binding transcriptional ArsR family regulator
MKMLEVRPLSVSEIQYALKGSQPNISHHMKALVDAGLVEKRKDGLWSVYSIANHREDPLKAGLLALVRRSLNNDDVVIDDRIVIKRVERISLSVRMSRSVSQKK